MSPAAPSLRILYDGWPLVYAPGGPAAFHLAALLAALPPEAQPLVALPTGSSPAWLPSELEILPAPAPSTPVARLRWEQVTLPALARRSTASILHLVSPHPAWQAPCPVVVSPAVYPTPAASPPLPRRSLAERLRKALSRGASGSVAALLWPSDLPAPNPPPPVFSLPPLPFSFLSPLPSSLHPSSPDSFLLPPSFILFHGPGDPLTLRRLLAAWSWASPALGEDIPLLAAGLDAAGRGMLAGLLARSEQSTTVRILPDLSPWEIASLYPQASAIFLPAETSPWGDALVEGLACGRPVVSLETPCNAARTGPGAYLARAEDPRALGAALITVVVEEAMAEGLVQAAREKAATWDSQTFGERLLSLYRSLLP